MNELLNQIALCVEKGKIDQKSSYPPDMVGQDGTDELTKKALDSGLAPSDILSGALIEGMKIVGEKFRNNEIYLPDVLMSAKAMSTSMVYLRPYFLSGEVSYKGTIIMGTVAGDLHDIGKKIVSMFFEGGGWKVIDLGVDVSAEKYIDAIKEHNPQAAGLSALLTTTMVNMEGIIRLIKKDFPDIKVLVGGAPVTQAFSSKIGADCYSRDPQGALLFLNDLIKIDDELN